MNEHVCTVCFELSEDHNAECAIDEIHQQHSHFPELCCLGCDCGSFERAHTEAELAYLVDASVGVEKETTDDAE